jgi:hypothetical protein
MASGIRHIQKITQPHTRAVTLEAREVKLSPVPWDAITAGAVLPRAVSGGDGDDANPSLKGEERR